jgi:hypothetical protein
MISYDVTGPLGIQDGTEIMVQTRKARGVLIHVHACHQTKPGTEATVRIGLQYEIVKHSR